MKQNGDPDEQFHNLYFRGTLGLTGSLCVHLKAGNGLKDFFIVYLKSGKGLKVSFRVCLKPGN